MSDPNFSDYDPLLAEKFFLSEALYRAPRKALLIITMARALGFSLPALYRAKKALGIQSEGYGVNKRWRLPQQD
jgi:hypothetical protein